MSYAPLMYEKLLKEIPKHKTAKDAILASGFSPSVANTQAKRVLHGAIKYQAQKILGASKSDTGSSRELMSEIVGLSREDVFDTLRKIAKQDKDYGSALKVLAPLAKEHGVSLSPDDDQKTINVPILNLSFGTPSTPQVIEHK